MNKKTVLGIMLTLLSIGTLALAFSLQPVRDLGTIYISVRAENNVTTTSTLSSSAPNIAFRELYPVSPNTTDDLILNATCADADPGDSLTLYWDVYNNSIKVASLSGSSSTTNGTEFSKMIVEDGNTTIGEEWQAKVWCGDGTINSSVVSTHVRTIAGHFVTFTLNYPPNESANISRSPTLNVTVINLEGGPLNVSFLESNASFPTEHTIDGSLYGSYTVYAIDLDQDGDVDVLGAAAYGNIVWYENDGSESFTKHILYFPHAYRVFATDIDGDGDIDILGSAFDWIDGTSPDEQVAWFENDGSESFTKHVVANIESRSVHADDIDEDGDVDLLTTSYQHCVSWWENNGSESFTRHTLLPGGGVGYSAYSTDLDKDGDVDIVVGKGAVVGWLKNDGSESFTKHDIGSAGIVPNVYPIDLDQDGDVDVSCSSKGENDIIWYENNGSESFTKHVVDGSFSDAYSVYPIDLDQDGDVDVLGAAQTAGDIAWYENNGSESFTKYVINGSFNGAHTVHATDVDSDGDIDVLGAGGHDIVWWENNQSIGQDLNVASGSNAILTWSGLNANTTYNWRVKAEMNPADYSDTWQFTTGLTHDIAVTNITTSKTVVGQGYSMNITVTVENQGDFTECFNVSVYYDDTAIILPDGKNYTTTTLTSRNSTTITFQWNTTGVAKGNYTIKAYAWPVPGETDTTDNTLTDGWVIVAMPGDITGATADPWDFIPDGKVDGKDLFPVSKGFGAYPGIPVGPAYPIWHPNSDINGDGQIDGRDIFVIKRHFGETDP